MIRIFILFSICSSFVFSSFEITQPQDSTNEKEVVYVGSNDDGANGRFNLSAYKHNTYYGVGIGVMKADSSKSANAVNVSLLVGLTLSDYMSVEGRYSTLIADADVDDDVVDIDMSNISVFLKQYMPISETFAPYGLLGYGITYYDEESDKSLEWGLGFNYMYSEDNALFFEYISYYDDDFNDKFSESIDISSFSFGTMFRF